MNRFKTLPFTQGRVLLGFKNVNFPEFFPPITASTSLSRNSCPSSLIVARSRFITTSSAYFAKPRDPEILQDYMENPEDRRIRLRLLDVNGTLIKSNITKSDARRIARDKNLRLMLLKEKNVEEKQDTILPTYQLISGKSLAEERQKIQQEKKAERGHKISGQKQLMLKTSSESHDLQLKFKHAEEWLQKRYQILVDLEVDWPKLKAKGENPEEKLAWLAKETRNHFKNFEFCGEIGNDEREEFCIKFVIKPK